MAALQFGKGAFKRTYAKEPQIVLLNRFFEQNPSNRVDAVALLSRPGSRFLAGAGKGPIRADFFQDGTIDGNLFTVSGDELYMFEKDLTRTHILGVVDGDTPVMAGTSTAMWITDGKLLQFYDGVGSRAQGLLTVSANPANADTVTLGTQTYTFVTALPAAPSEVLIGATADDSVQNLTDAINRALGEGTRYGANTQANAAAVAVNNEDGTMTAIAKAGGVAGNAVATTETGADTAWGATTLLGGVNDSLSGCATPDDVGIVSLCVLNGFVFLAAAKSDRIYWILPGEITIDPLNFVTAEAQPDEIISLMTVGDQVWCFGSQTTQALYLTGDEDAPVGFVQGRAFSQGTIEGTPCLLNQVPILVGNDNIVYMVAGAAKPVSDEGISERIRKALKAERDSV